MENLNGAKTRQQMADEYGICRKTFSRLLIRKNIKIDPGLILPCDQQRIYEKLGEPVRDIRFPKIPKISG